MSPQGVGDRILARQQAVKKQYLDMIANAYRVNIAGWAGGFTPGVDDFVSKFGPDMTKKMMAAGVITRTPNNQRFQINI